MRDYSLLVFILLVAVTAVTGATNKPGVWYESLIQPSFTPPRWAFPVVWSIIYVMIAIAGWLVWRAEGFGLLIALWAAQLVLNGAWSYIMFTAHEIGWALVDILALLAVIVLFIVVAAPNYPIAAGLFGVYAAWVAFATALNYEFWRLNAG